MSEISLTRTTGFDTDFVLVDGQCGGGKMLISRMLETFKNMELSKEDLIFYYIMNLYRFGLLEKESSKSLLKINKDRLLYEQTIGRQINTRFSDSTCIFNHPYPLDYFKRLFNKEREYTNKIIIKNKPIFQNMISNALTNCRLFFDTFGLNMKFIYVVRNPYDVINNIYSRGFGERIGTDPSEMQYTFKWKDKSIPIYAYGWEKEYLNSKPLDRVIKMVYTTSVDDLLGYEKLESKYKKNVLFIDFNDFTINTKTYIKLISNFLDTSPTWKTRLTLRKEDCPRKPCKNIPIKHDIFTKCSEENRYVLMELEELYNKELVMCNHTCDLYW